MDENIDEICIKQAFYTEGPIAINIARINHLKTLNFDFFGKTVIEVGCGGKGDFTKFLLNEGAIVTISDARKENMEYLLKNNNLDLNKILCDFNKELNNCEQYDIVFSYGLLYHLENPIVGIKNFKKLCKDDGKLILCTVINNSNEEKIDYVIENMSKEQSFNTFACRPSKLWVINELKKHFKYVYSCKTKPNHPDFLNNIRTIFLASNEPHDSENWD